MTKTNSLTLNDAEWDFVANAVLAHRRYADPYTGTRILNRMHSARYDTESRRRADREMGMSVLHGPVKLPWDKDGAYEKRAKKYPPHRPNPLTAFAD